MRKERNEVPTPAVLAVRGSHGKLGEKYYLCPWMMRIVAYTTKNPVIRSVENDLITAVVE
jgi:hypothetical protein